MKPLSEGGNEKDFDLDPRGFITSYWQLQQQSQLMIRSPLFDVSLGQISMSQHVRNWKLNPFKYRKMAKEALQHIDEEKWDEHHTNVPSISTVIWITLNGKDYVKEPLVITIQPKRVYCRCQH